MNHWDRMWEWCDDHLVLGTAVCILASLAAGAIVTEAVGWVMS